MRRVAIAVALLLCAAEARAEDFDAKWVRDLFCEGRVPSGFSEPVFLRIASDTEMLVCHIAGCPVEPRARITGTTTQISRRRAVFVGFAESNPPYGGAMMFEADLRLRRDGTVGRVHGRFISPSADVGLLGTCASHGKIRSYRRTD